MIYLPRPAPVVHEDVFVHGDLHDGGGMGFVIMATCVLQVEAQELVLFRLKPLLEIGQGTLQGTFLVGVDHPQHGAAADREAENICGW